MEEEAILRRLEEGGGTPPELWSKEGSWIIRQEKFLGKDPNEFTRLDLSIDWQQDEMTIYGRKVPLPRLTAWYGDPGTDYVYSGIRNVPKAWTSELLAIRQELRDRTGLPFNAMLANRYADGNQHQGYHADDEPAFGSLPIIASLSFGASRRFLVKHKRSRETATFELKSGDLLIMGGRLQEDFIHALPKTKKVHGPRINLTFRTVIAEEKRQTPKVRPN